MLPNVSIKSVVNKENRRVAIKKIWKRHNVLHLWLDFLSSFREIKREYYLKGYII